jgi:segregation and condensation protein A
MFGAEKSVQNSSSQEVQPYRVRLKVFEGPLDLLLHLIEKQELDITTVSLAVVTDQYLEYIARLERVSVEDLADFLVVAARLLLIKSRALLPSPPLSEAEEEEDLGADLVRRLKEYRKFKQAAQLLREREESGLRAYLRVAPPPRLERKLDMTGLSVDELVSAVREALLLRPAPVLSDEVVAPITVSISHMIQRIESLLVQERSFSFNRLLQSAASRTELIVTFLAVLELIKAQRVWARQERLFGEILILSADEPVPTPAA